MNLYEVKLIHHPCKNNYWYTVKYAPILYCTGIKELRLLCGGRLHYSQNAKCYMGHNGNIEYVAKKYSGNREEMKLWTKIR